MSLFKDFKSKIEVLKDLKPIQLFKIFNIFEWIDIRLKYYQLLNENNKLKYEKEEIRFELLYYKIMDYYSSNDNSQYLQELNYLHSIKNVDVFPYKQLKTFDDIEFGMDNKYNLPYVIHKNKKLFFSEIYGIEGARNSYKNFIEVENLFGGGYKEKAPHQYQSENVKVEQGDIVVDIGAAEGLFSLDIIDKVNKVILIENDEKWLKPLRATFEPYKDKVTIINKSISDKDNKNEVTLETCLKKLEIKGLFIKMDIEGYETTAIRINENILSKPYKTRLVCCTYHNQNDANELEELFKNYGYKTEFSDGYMIFRYDENISPPYFRKGVIRAKMVF